MKSHIRRDHKGSSAIIEKILSLFVLNAPKPPSNSTKDHSSGTSPTPPHK
jgi:hypothetical protein